MATYILGISAFYHDSAAALICDGHIVAAAQEERFTRKKHDPEFPKNAIQFCLSEAKIEFSQINYIVFYDKPFIKFERLLETYLSFAPKGFISFLQAMPLWMKEKLFLKTLLKKSLSKLAKCECSIFKDIHPSLVRREVHLKRHSLFRRNFSNRYGANWGLSTVC